MAGRPCGRDYYLRRGIISLGGFTLPFYEGVDMTRIAIERCIKVFIVALILTFIWTVSQVLGMLGLF